MTTRVPYGALFTVLTACQPVPSQTSPTPVDVSEPADAIPADTIPAGELASTVAPTAKPRRVSGCAAATKHLQESLREGMPSVELKNALSHVDFVYREQRVMDNHHLTLPTKGEQAFQFGCIDEPVEKFDVELGDGEGPIPATRFFMRVAGSERPDLKSFLASANGELLQLAVVHDSPEERQRQMLMGFG